MKSVYCRIDSEGLFHILSADEGDRSGRRAAGQTDSAGIRAFFDGRVFNLPELVASLGREGLGPGAAPEDVVRHWYERGELSRLSLLDGCYAFVLWDERERVLVAGCDPVGNKRLYYSKTPSGFLCSSSLTRLVKTPGFERTISEIGLVEYFTYGYTIPPCTIYGGVDALTPGRHLVYKGNAVEVHTHRDPIPEVWEFSDTKGLTENDLVDELERLMVDSVQRRLPEGRRVAAYLSGGLDTSLVCAILKKHTQKDVTAITLGSNDPACDETSYARETASALKINDHAGYYITRDDFFEALFSLSATYGQPFADSSAIPSYVIAREVSGNFDSVFAGEGVDGLYGGVDFRLWHHYYRVTPYALRIPMSIAADYVIRWFRKDLISPSLHVAELLRQPDYFWIYHKMFKGVELERLLGKRVTREAFWGYRYLRSRTDIPLYERLRLAFLTIFITHDVLQKAVGAHTTHAVDLICPYHDTKLMDFIQRLPSDYKFRNGRGKYLHKRLLSRYVPEGILNRPKKGFRIDYSEFGVDTLRGLTDEYVNEKNLSETGYLNVRFALECVDRYFKGDMRMGPLLWSLLVFEIWRKQYSI